MNTTTAAPAQVKFNLDLDLRALFAHPEEASLNVGLAHAWGANKSRETGLALLAALGEEFGTAFKFYGESNLSGYMFSDCWATLTGDPMELAKRVRAFAEDYLKGEGGTLVNVYGRVTYSI